MKLRPILLRAVSSKANFGLYGLKRKRFWLEVDLMTLRNSVNNLNANMFSFLDNMKNWSPKRWFAVTLVIWLIGLAALSIAWMLGIDPGTLSTNQSVGFESYGPIGDYFGGIMAPFIGLIGAVLTFAAFYIQYQANEDQRNALIRQENEQRATNARQEEDLRQQATRLNEQERQRKIDRFEQQFFEMLKIHRSNAEGFIVEFDSNGQRMEIKGKRAFRMAGWEVDYIFYSLQQMQAMLGFAKGLSKKELFFVAFRIAYWGFKPSKAGPRYGKEYKLAEIDLFLFQNEFVKMSKMAGEKSATEVMEHCQELENSTLDSGDESDIQSQTPDYFLIASRFMFPLGYEVATGHYHAWSHYFRHFQRILELIDQFDPLIMSFEERRQYGRILRSQLSNDEEKHLYYYSLVPEMGATWCWETGYMKKYELIRNIVLREIPGGISPVQRMRDYLIEMGASGYDPEIQYYFDADITHENLI